MIRICDNCGLEEMAHLGDKYYCSFELSKGTKFEIKEMSLSNKFFLLKDREKKHGDWEVVEIEEVQEKIQNAQKRLKKFVNDMDRDMDNMRISRDYTVIEINKIFLEEFGNKLLEDQE